MLRMNSEVFGQTRRHRGRVVRPNGLSATMGEGAPFAGYAALRQ